MEIKNIGQLIQHLATKAGIDAADPNLVNVLSNAELSKVPVHSDLVTGIDNSLLSISQATDNHPDIKKKYHAQAMNAFDKKMEEVMAASGLSEEKIDELKGEKSTYKRFELLSAALKEAGTVKKDGQTAEEKSALQKQVDDLLEASKKAKKDFDSSLSAEKEARRTDRIRYELKSMLGGIKTVFDDLPGGAKEAALDSIINKALQDKKASFDFDDTDTFILKGEGDTSVVGANSTKYTPKTFIDEVLAQNKVLKVSDPKHDTTTTQQGSNGTQQRTITVDAGTKAVTGNNQTTANLNRRNREAAEKNMQTSNA